MKLKKGKKHNNKGFTLRGSCSTGGKFCCHNNSYCIYIPRVKIL